MNFMKKMTMMAFLFFSMGLFAQTPSLVNGLPAQAFPGDQVCFDLSVTNTGNPGYNPYIRLILPSVLTFNSANYLGINIATTTVGVFPASPGNQLTDPVTGGTVTGPAGSTLIILTIPLGSIVESGPDTVVEVCSTLATSSAIGTPYSVSAQPVYEHGDSPTGTTPIIGSVVTRTLTPIVWQAFKENDAHESEMPPSDGSNYLITYTLTIDVANTKTVGSVDVTDTLPANLQYVAPITITGGTGASIDVEPSGTTPGGNLSVSFSGITGTASDTDVTITYRGYIVDILDETNCGTSLLTNETTFNGTYAANPLPEITDTSNVTAKHICIQKGANPTAISPGDTVTYTLNFQVTDFGTANSLVVVDTLPDGITFGAHQSMTVSGSTTAITPSVNHNANGTTVVTYDVHAVTGDLDPATTGTITYTATVDQIYESNVNIETNPDYVLASDSLINSVVANYSLTAGATGCSDDSGATITVIPITIVKEVRNLQSEYVPGESVTYRLTMTIPSGDTHNVIFEDYFPLPIFDVTTLDTNTNLAANANISLASTDTMGLTPTSITVDAPTNSLRVNWPDVITSSAQTISIDIDITVEDDPFADNLFLTNLFQAYTYNSPLAVASEIQPVQIHVRAPVLDITKGILSTTHGTISPLPSILPVDGNLSNADGSDTVTFQVTLENIGGASAYDVVITDPAITGLGTYTITSVVNGSGTPLAYTGNINGGITLTNPLAGNDGSIGAPYSTDTAIVTYTAVIDSTIEAGDVLTNTASAVWASQSGAVTFGAITDSAIINIADASVSKTITAIAPGYAGNLTEAQIGEVLTYQVVITVPEGVSSSVSLVDTLDSGLAFTDDIVSITPSSGDITTDFAGGYAGVLAAAVFSNNDGTLTFNFGNVTNTNTVDATVETITVIYRVRVLNTTTNVRGVGRNNNAVWTSDSSSDNNRAANVTIIEPTLTATKLFSASSADAGDTLTVTIDIAHSVASNGDAFDVTLSDVLPAGLTFLGSLSSTGGLSPTVGPAEAGGTITASWSSFPQGSTAQITFQVTVDTTVNPDETITNNAVVEWESLLTADQGALPNCPNNTLGVERTGNTSDPGTTANTYRNTGSDSITIANADVAKVITSINPNGAPGYITCGDSVTYSITVTLPEGLAPALTLTDDLPAGLQYQSVTVDDTGYNGTVDNTPAVTVSGLVGTGQSILFEFGDTPTVNDNNTGNNSFVVDIVARVNDDSANDGLPAVSNKTNTITLDYTGNTSTLTDIASINFAEPGLTITKTMSPNSDVDAGDTITIQLVIENTGTAPAHDIVITDDVSSATGLFDLATVTEGTTPTGFTYGYANPNVTYTGSGTLAAGASVTFTFTANVITNVVTGSAYTNTASVTASSQTGVVVGERGISTNDSATLNVANGTRSKALIATSENSTNPGDTNLAANPPVAIGEVLTYELTFAFPEGVTNNVELIDLIPSGLTYLTGTATLRKTSTALTSVTNPSTINATAINTPVSVTLDTATTGQISLALGNITNTDTDNNTAEQYILSLQTVVANSAGNNAGTTLSNTGRMTYNNVLGTNIGVNSTAVSVHVAEPTITISKGAAPATVDGGDTVTFTVRITNTSTGANAAHAFDGTFTDILPSEFKITPAPSVTNIDVTNTAMVSGDVVASFTGNTLNGTYTDLAPGEYFEITYTAVVDELTPFATVITNTVSTIGTSLPGDHGTANATAGNSGDADGERNGSGGVNDLATSDNASVALSVPTLAKTTLNYFPPYAIGEEAEFEITVSVPLGTTTNFVLTDVLDSELAFVAGSLSVNLSAGVSVTNTPLNETNTTFFDLTGDTITLDFGSVTSSNNGTITITYNAEVENILVNQVGQSRDNSVSFVFDDPENPGSQISVGPVVTDKPVIIGEPNLEMTKSITSGAVNSNAGDTISWEVTIENTGNLTAYRVNWSDVLPSGLYQISTPTLAISGGDIFLNGTTTVPNSGSFAISTTTSLNDTVTLPLLEIENGATLTITFDSILMDTVTPGQVINNVTSANYTSLTTGGRDNSTDPGNVDDDDDTDLNNYEESASQNLTVLTGLSVDKTADKASATIGEEVVFTIRVDVIEGTTEDIVVTDILPVGFTYQSHLITAGNTGMVFGNGSYNTNLGSGQIVSFGFGDVVNPGNNISTDNYFTVAITTKVDNIVGNQNNDILRNGENVDSSETYVTYGPSSTRVDFDYDGGTSGIQGIPVTITEPDLTVTKTVTPSTQSLGDEVTYTVTVAHSGSSTEDAYDLILTDTLPSGLTYVSNSASLPAVDVTVVGQVIEFKISSLTLTDSSTNFTYKASVDNDVTEGTTLTNGIDLEWSSIPSATGDADDGRNGIDGTGGLNDYVDSDSATVTSAINTFIDATKTVTLFEDNGTAGQVDPGDMLEYTVTLVNTNGDATGVIFYDTIPVETTFVPGSLVSSDGVEDETGAPDLAVNIGNMASGATISMTFRVTVNAGTPAGTIISNQGYVDSDSTVPEPTDEDGIDGNGDQPTDIPVGDTADPVDLLYASKSVGWLTDTDGSSSVTATDVMRYTIIFSNLGTTDLTGITFSDTIPNGLTYVPASASITAPGGSISVTGQSVTAAFPSLLLTDIVSLSFNVTIDSPLVNFDADPLSETFVNQGTASSNETSPVLTDGNGDPSDGEQPTFFTAVNGGLASPLIDVEKRWSLDTDLNGNTLVNPLDTILYTITVANHGSATATNVRVTDPIPANMTYVTGSATTSRGAVFSTTPTLGVNIGNLAPGESATISFRTTVNAGTADGTIIPNQATATGDNFSDEPSDDNGNDGDGKNPTLTPVNDGGSTSGVPTAYVKQLVNTSEADTLGNNLLIGEVATFSLTVTMPTGTVKEVSIVDALPVGFSYVANSATLTRVFNTGIQASSNPANINGAASGVPVALADGSSLIVAGQQISVFLGDVINSDNDVDDEQFVLQFQALTDNILSNQSGTVLNNTGQIRYQNSLSQNQFLNSNTVAMSIVEANLHMAKSVTAGDVGSFPGDTISYRLEIRNISSGAAAYNVNIADILPGDLQGGVGATGTAPYFYNMALTNPGNAVVFTASGTPVNVTDLDISSGDTMNLQMVTIPPMTTLTITYDITVALSAAPDAVIDNTATSSYSSLPGGSGRLNTDIGSDDDNNSDLNNYNENITATLVLCDEIIVTASCDGGTVNPTEIRLCRGDGNCAEFTFEPKEGYHIVSYEVNGEPGCFCPNNPMTIKTLCDLTEDTDIHVKYVKSEDPVITNFTATPDSGIKALTVSYTVEAYDPDTYAEDATKIVCHADTFEREIKQYQWDFDNDGVIDLTTREGNATHIFALPGLYYSTVTVMDNEMTTTKSQKIAIHVTTEGVSYLPVFSVSGFEGISNASSWVINNNETFAEIKLTAEDESGAELKTEVITLDAFGKTMIPYAIFDSFNYKSLKVVSTQALIVYSDMATETGIFATYIGDKLHKNLIAPHIAEETEQWTTKSFVANTEKRNLIMTVRNVEKDLEPKSSYIIDLSGEADSMNKIFEDTNYYASFKAQAFDPFGNYSVLTGFEYFSLIDGDTAGTELIGNFSKHLYMPYIPREADKFWTGFALVNTETETASVSLNFYSFTGEMIGVYNLNVNANAKKKVLISDTFPEIDGIASWAKITSDRDLAGIEIFGSFKEENSGGGICGFSLNGKAEKEGILPFVNGSENQWTGIAITNINNEAITVELKLVSSDGTVKETVVVYIDELAQYKGLVRETFENSTPETGDYVKYSCSVEVLAAEIGGENDWSKMKALNSTK